MIQTRKSDKFQIIPCPKCGSNFKVLRGSITNLPDECPVCLQLAEPQETPADNTLVMTQATLAKLATEQAQHAAKIRRLESDIKSILAIVVRDSSALNTDVPETTKHLPLGARPEPEADHP